MHTGSIVRHWLRKPGFIARVLSSVRSDVRCLCPTLIGLLLLFGFSTPAPAESRKTVTIRADVWYPMNGDTNQPQRLGYMIDMAKAIFAAHGYQVDYKNGPWDRDLRSVRRGRNDCVVGAFHSDAPDFVFPKVSWGVAIIGVYVKKGNPWRYTGQDSLNGKTLALIGSYSYTPTLNHWAKHHEHQIAYVYANNSLEQEIHMVLKARVDATVSTVDVMEAKLKDMGLEGQLQQVGTVGKPTQMYIACSPAEENSKLYVQWVDEGTRALRSSGQLQQILDKYGLKDWK